MLQAGCFVQASVSFVILIVSVIAIVFAIWTLLKPVHEKIEANVLNADDLFHKEEGILKYAVQDVIKRKGTTVGYKCKAMDIEVDGGKVHTIQGPCEMKCPQKNQRVKFSLGEDGTTRCMTGRANEKWNVCDTHISYKVDGEKIQHNIQIPHHSQCSSLGNKVHIRRSASGEVVLDSEYWSPETIGYIVLAIGFIIGLISFASFSRANSKEGCEAIMAEEQAKLASSGFGTGMMMGMLLNSGGDGGSGTYSEVIS